MASLSCNLNVLISNIKSAGTIGMKKSVDKVLQHIVRCNREKLKSSREKKEYAATEVNCCNKHLYMESDMESCNRGGQINVTKSAATMSRCCNKNTRINSQG